MKNGKYAEFFDDNAFNVERGDFIQPEDKHVCSCSNPDLLYCYVHKKHFAIIANVKTLVESSGMNVL